MSKVKSHKGLLKRVRVTARGKVAHKARGTSHLMSTFSGDRKRKLRRPTIVSRPVAKKMERALNRRLKGREQA